MKTKKLSLTIGKFLFLSVAFTFLTACNEKMKAPDILPLALQGQKLDAYTEPLDSEENPTTGKTTDPGSVEFYVETDTTGSSTCTANTEPPTSFGENGPEAYFRVCDTSEVDRYKSLEIIFSHAMKQAKDPLNPEEGSVEANFSITGKTAGALLGPGGGGTFIWRSPRRLIFDPYKELNSSETYTLSISAGALTEDGKALKAFSKEFTASHDYLLNVSVNQGVNNYTLGGVDDVTLEKDEGAIILNTNFVNTANVFDTIQKVQLKKMGNTELAVDICLEPCSSLASPMDLSSTSLPPSIGGNTYYYEINTKSGKTYKRYFSFNYGDVNTEVNGLVKNVASGVLDEAHMVKFLKRVVERFTANDFKVTGKTFNDFAGLPKSNAKNTTKCINYTDGEANFQFVKSYGDNPDGGYCGPNGNEGLFVGTYNGILSFWSNSYFDMDVYVGSISIPGLTDGNDTVKAEMVVNSDGEMGIDLKGRKAYITLNVIARNRSTLGLVIPSGSKFFFSTNITLNGSDNSLRLARARTALGVNSEGVLNLAINTPHVPTDPINGNFYVDGWVQNLVVGNMELIKSTSWAADLLEPITEMIANGLVPQVKGAITQNMLKDVVQKIAPDVLNAVVGNLKTEGVTIALPDYLPAPLGGYPLNAKIQLSSDARVRHDGTNKAIVASVHTGITAATPNTNPRSHSAKPGFVYTKNPNEPLINPENSEPFKMSAANPGMMLALHSDAVNQAAYHMWKNRVLDLSIDENFIDAINSFAGDDPLLKLSKSILKASAIVSILAPGQNEVKGVDASGTPLTPISGDDAVIFKIDPVMPPVLTMIPHSTYDPADETSGPSVKATFNDLQLTVQGKRKDGTKYTIGTVRVSLLADAKASFKEFSNKPCAQGLASCDTNKNNLNALSVKIFTSNLHYTLAVLEGSTYNPYGLDPKGITTVLDPLVTSLVVPLVNSVLHEIPLPGEVPFPALTNPSSGAVCNLSARTDNAIAFKGLKVPAADAGNPYLFANIPLKGSAVSDPGSIIVAPCN